MMILTRLPAAVAAFFRGVRRLKPKQGAGLFLIALMMVPSSMPVRAADPGPQAPTSSVGQVPTSASAAIVGNTGTFTTGVEIDLPPGRVGMVPKLGMSYASGWTSVIAVRSLAKSSHSGRKAIGHPWGFLEPSALSRHQKVYSQVKTARWMRHLFVGQVRWPDDLSLGWTLLVRA